MLNNCLAALVTLELSNAFLLYLACSLGTLLLIWLIHDIRARHRKIELAEHSLHTCEYCQKTYLEDKTKEITKCPLCASYNSVATQQKPSASS